MLLMSLLSLPQLSAEIFTRRYMPLTLLSFIIALAGGIGGLAVAWWISVPASAAIVLILVAIYALSSVAGRILRI